MAYNKNILYALFLTLVSVGIMKFCCGNIAIAWYHPIIMFIILRPYQIGTHVFSLLGGFSDGNLYSLIGIFSHSEYDNNKLIGLGINISNLGSHTQIGSIGYTQCYGDIRQLLGIGIMISNGNISQWLGIGYINCFYGISNYIGLGFMISDGGSISQWLGIGTTSSYSETSEKIGIHLYQNSNGNLYQNVGINLIQKVRGTFYQDIGINFFQKIIGACLNCGRSSGFLSIYKCGSSKCKIEVIACDDCFRKRNIIYCSNPAHNSEHIRKESFINYNAFQRVSINIIQKSDQKVKQWLSVNLFQKCKKSTEQNFSLNFLQICEYIIEQKFSLNFFQKADSRIHQYLALNLFQMGYDIDQNYGLSLCHLCQRDPKNIHLFSLFFLRRRMKI